MLKTALALDRIEPQLAVVPAAEGLPPPWGLTLDSALLCGHVRHLIAQDGVASAMDVGCSVGLTTAWSAWRNRDVRITGIDVHADAIAAASRLRLQPELDGQVEFVCMSYGDLWRQRFDLVFANPPYIPNLVGIDGMDASAVGTELLLDMLREPFRHVSPAGRMVLVLSSTSFACAEIRMRVEGLAERGQARRVSRTRIPFNVSHVRSAPAFMHELERRGAVTRASGGYFHDAEVWEFARD